MPRSRVSLQVERLETRYAPATFYNPWPDARTLTLSFAADNTRIGPQLNRLHQLLDATSSTNVWQTAILRAFQTWAVHANINIGVVPDGGQVFGSTGAVQGDPRFGDIRVGAYPFSESVLALEQPFDVTSGTWSGDLLFNSNYRWGGTDGFDLFSVALHEAGHAFGLDHSTDPASPLYAQYLGPRTGLIAEDIARLQALYGPRQHDAFEGSHGNNSFSRAAPLPLLDGVSLVEASGDLRTVQDVDYYIIGPGVNLSSSSLHFTLRTAGISSLTARISVYNSARQLLGSAYSTNPLNGDVTVRINTGMPSLLSTYYIKVESARSDVFGVGSYRLEVTPSSPLSLGSVVGLAGTLLNPDYHSNDTLVTALGLPQLITQTDNRFDYVYKASISDAADVDYYSFKAPTPPPGSPNVLSVMVWGLEGGALNPALQLFDPLNRPMVATVLARENGMSVLQVPHAEPNALYKVAVRPATPGSHDRGNYLLGIDFSTRATQLQELASNRPGMTTNAFELSSTADQLYHFVLTTDSGSTDATVQVSVLNPAGQVFQALTVRPHEVRSVKLFLQRGSYNVRVTGSGATAPTFALAGLDLSDPVRPYPYDANGAPAGGGSGGSGSGSGSGSGGSGGSGSGGSASTSWYGEYDSTVW